MINIIIKDGKQTEKRKVQIGAIGRKRKTRYLELFITTTMVCALAKAVMKHDREITSLKKVIEEMKSKGE